MIWLVQVYQDYGQVVVVVGFQVVQQQVVYVFLCCQICVLYQLCQGCVIQVFGQFVCIEQEVDFGVVGIVCYVNVNLFGGGDFQCLCEYIVLGVMCGQFWIELVGVDQFLDQ